MSEYVTKQKKTQIYTNELNLILIGRWESNVLVSWKRGDREL